MKARGVPQFSTGTLKKNVHSGSSDEDPYSLTPSGSSGSSGKGLRDRSRDESGTRARDSDGYGPQNWAQHKGIPNDLSDDYVEVKRRKLLSVITRISCRTTFQPGKKCLAEVELDY